MALIISIAPPLHETTQNQRISQKSIPQRVSRCRENIPLIAKELRNITPAASVLGVLEVQRSLFQRSLRGMQRSPTLPSFEIADRKTSKPLQIIIEPS